MSDPARSAPPPESTGYMQPPSNPHYYAPSYTTQPSVDLDNSPKMIPTPGGSPTQYSGTVAVHQSRQSSPWGILPGGQQGNYSDASYYSDVQHPHPLPHHHPHSANQYMQHSQPPWTPPPAPQLRPGQIIVDKERYESDLKEIDDLRRAIRQMKLDFHKEQEEHDENMHKLKLEMQVSHRQRIDDQKQHMTALEQMVDDLKQQVEDATHSVSAEPPQPAYSTSRVPEPQWNPPPPVQQAPQVLYPAVAGEERADCPMQCGFSGSRDLLQVHMFECHPELFADEGSSVVNPQRSAPEAKANDPKSDGKMRLVTVVLPGNAKDEIMIAEDATVREFNEKIQQVTGRDRERLRLVVGGQVLNADAPLTDTWLSVIPKNFKQVPDMFVMCIFKQA